MDDLDYESAPDDGIILSTHVSPEGPASRFARLPVELHNAIAAQLDVVSQLHLRATCRQANAVAFERWRLQAPVPDGFCSTLAAYILARRMAGHAPVPLAPSKWARRLACVRPAPSQRPGPPGANALEELLREKTTSLRIAAPIVLEHRNEVKALLASCALFPNVTHLAATCVCKEKPPQRQGGKKVSRLYLRGNPCFAGLVSLQADAIEQHTVRFFGCKRFLAKVTAWSLDLSATVEAQHRARTAAAAATDLCDLFAERPATKLVHITFFSLAERSATEVGAAGAETRREAIESALLALSVAMAPCLDLERIQFSLPGQQPPWVAQKPFEWPAETMWLAALASAVDRGCSEPPALSAALLLGWPGDGDGVAKPQGAATVVSNKQSGSSPGRSSPLPPAGRPGGQPMAFWHTASAEIDGVWP